MSLYTLQKKSAIKEDSNPGVLRIVRPKLTLRSDNFIYTC